MHKIKHKSKYMRVIIFQGEPYFSGKDLPKDFSIEDIQEITSTMYKDVGRARSLRVCSVADKKNLLSEYAEVISLYTRDEVLNRLATKYHVKKTTIKRWLREERSKEKDVLRTTSKGEQNE